MTSQVRSPRHRSLARLVARLRALLARVRELALAIGKLPSWPRERGRVSTEGANKKQTNSGGRCGHIAT